MVSIESRQRTFTIPDALVSAVTAQAQRQADLVGSYLRSSGLFDPKPIRIPAAALMELAAILQIGVWEKRGLLLKLNHELPRYSDASQEFVARCSKGLSEFNGPEASPLSLKVLAIWIDHFAWDGQELLGADFVIGNFDENEFVDMLAKFIWDHKNELIRLLEGDNSE